MSKWTSYNNDSDGSLSYHYPSIWTNNTPSSGSVLKTYQTNSLYGENRNCFIELQFPFEFNASYQYYSGNLSFWYSLDFSNIENLTEVINVSVIIQRADSQNVSLDGWNDIRYSNESGDVDWTFKDFSFNSLNSTLNETGNYTLIFRSEFSHIRNGTNISPGISKIYLDEITFFMNFTAKQLQQNDTTGLQKSLTIDRAVRGNLTVSGIYFTDSLVSSTLNQNFSVFLWLHNISLFIANLTENMASPQFFSFQVNFSSLPSTFNLSYLLMVNSPMPPIILPNESTIIQFSNLSLLANTLPTVDQINCSLFDSETGHFRNLTELSWSPPLYDGLLNFTSAPILSNPGFTIAFIVNETNIQFNYVLNISYLSVQDTIFAQYYRIFTSMKSYLGSLNAYISTIQFNQSVLTSFEPYFKLLEQNRTLQALRSLYEADVSDAYVIHHYLVYLLPKIGLNQWYGYLFYDFGIQEFLSIRIQGILSVLDDYLLSIYHRIKNGDSGAGSDRLYYFYDVIDSLDTSIQESIVGTTSGIIHPELGIFPIVSMRSVDLFLQYCQNYTSFYQDKRLIEFILFQEDAGVPTLLSFGSSLNNITTRDYITISAEAAYILAYIFMIYSMKSVDITFIQLSESLKSRYTNELEFIPPESSNIILNQWNGYYDNGHFFVSLNLSTNTTSIKGAASLAIYYPLQNSAYLLAESIFNLSSAQSVEQIWINFTIPETSFILALNQGYNQSIYPYLLRLTIFDNSGIGIYWNNFTAFSNLTMFGSAFDLNIFQKIYQTVNYSALNLTIGYDIFKFDNLVFGFQHKIFLPQFQREIDLETLLPIFLFSTQESFIDKIELLKRANGDLTSNIEVSLKDRFNDPIYTGTKILNIPVKYILSIPANTTTFTLSTNITIVQGQNTTILNLPIQFEYYYLDEEPPVLINTMIFSILVVSMMSAIAVVFIRTFKLVYLEYYIRKRKFEALDRF